MPGKKRLATIEEPKVNLELTPLITQIKYIQENLQKNIVLFPVNTPISHLMSKFDHLIYQKVLNRISDALGSMEKIQQTFQALLTDFKSESEALQVSNTYKPLCEGLELVIEWYRILAIDFFFQKPLTNEIAILEDKSDDKPILHERFTSLVKKINSFNRRVIETKQRLHDYKLSISKINSTDLKPALTELMLEDAKLMDYSETNMFNELGEERNNLVKELEDLTQEMQRNILYCRMALRQRRENRENLHELKLDVYYVDEFKDSYPDAFDAYRQSIRSKQRDKFLKVEAIEKLIENLSTPVRDFELSLTNYYPNTANVFHKISSNLYAINGIYDLLTKQLSDFKSNSPILRLELQYRELYLYLREGLPKVEKVAEENFIQAAKLFLKEVDGKNVFTKTKMATEADIAFNKEVEDEVSLLKFPGSIPPIKFVKFKELKKNILRDKWHEIFQKIFSQALQQMKADSEGVTDLKLLKKTENTLEIKYQELMSMPEVNRTPRAYEILNEVYVVVNRDPIILAIKERIKTMELSMQKKEPEMVHAAPKPEKKSHWYTPLIDKPWKRALCYGLLAFTLVLGAFTVWGLMAEMSALTIMIAGLSVGGISGVVVGSAYYLGQQCCGHGSTTIPLEPMPLSDLSFRKNPSVIATPPRQPTPVPRFRLFDDDNPEDKQLDSIKLDQSRGYR